MKKGKISKCNGEKNKEESSRVTRIELIIVIRMLGILAAIAMPMMSEC